MAPGARLACVTVLRTSLTGLELEVDEAGRPAYLSRLVALKDWAGKLNLPQERLSFHVLEAMDVGGAILDYAKRNDVDQIVMGARAASAMRRHLGSVSAKVVAEARCSVMVVRLRQRLEDEADEVLAERPGVLGDPAM
jgi:nucleotide-binding universal stress UspA family protein